MSFIVDGSIMASVASALLSATSTGFVACANAEAAPTAKTTTENDLRTRECLIFI